MVDRDNTERDWHTAEPPAREVDRDDPFDGRVPHQPPENWRAGYGSYGPTRHREPTPMRGGYGRGGYGEQGGYGGGGYAETGFGEARGGGWGPAPGYRGERGQGYGRPGNGVGGVEGGWGGGPTAEADWRPPADAGWRGEDAWGNRGGAIRGTEAWYRGNPYAGHAGAEWTQPGPHTGRGPEGYQRSPESIREDVCERLTRHGEVDASTIRVNVEGNEVVLEGLVDSRRAKRMAEDTAESVTGVRDVHNRLRVRDSTR